MRLEQTYGVGETIITGKIIQYTFPFDWVYYLVEIKVIIQSLSLPMWKIMKLFKFTPNLP